MDRIPKPGENVGGASRGQSWTKSTVPMERSSIGKKKRFDSVLLGLIVIMIIIILYAIFSSGEELGIDIPDIPLLSGGDNGGDLDYENQILEDAVETNNASLCTQLTDEQECYESLSMTSKEACIKVEDYEKMKECILYFAEEEKTLSLCNALNEEDKGECRLLADPCYGLEGNERKYCLAISEKNYSYCWDKNCVYDYAIETKDEEACDFFNTSAEKVACESLVEGWNRCNNNLALISEKDHCNYIFGKKTNDINYCYGLSEDGVYRYMCFVYFALEEEDYTYCDNLYFNDKWDCLTNYSLVTGDIGGCENIDSDWAQSHYEYCYFHYAVDYSMPKICEKLGGPTSKDSCYAQSIMDDSKPLDPEDCKDMDDDQWKDKCYKFAAEKNDDITICEKIENENTKTLCLNQFEE